MEWWSFRSLLVEIKKLLENMVGEEKENGLPQDFFTSMQNSIDQFRTVTLLFKY